MILDVVLKTTTEIQVSTAATVDSRQEKSLQLRANFARKYGKQKTTKQYSFILFTLVGLGKAKATCQLDEIKIKNAKNKSSQNQI